MANQIREEVVCVTGANGFIGTWIVKTLLQKHYKIHATIFPNSDPSHLFTLHPEAKSRITIFPVNILDSNAVSSAIKNCSGVFHVASPCTLEDPTDPQKELLEPAVQGTLNVLEASKRAGVKRVVLTSSISAMVPNPNWPEKTAIDETSWTDVEYCKLRGKWYPSFNWDAFQHVEKPNVSCSCGDNLVRLTGLETLGLVRLVGVKIQ
ncbi:hypothetical protein TSUD_397120 [Trifolium subterraneum]|uniref:NAD-dependent epimerase/dehydratase domain-containing protein n=1 Tax=Trifolium subterraneum TaxID=3900 RepID=A0A2Z6NC27_TRISU|nr:hypothetical protein TSUD_397120 [Trifolium subterraneum]